MRHPTSNTSPRSNRSCEVSRAERWSAANPAAANTRNNALRRKSSVCCAAAISGESAVMKNRGSHNGHCGENRERADAARRLVGDAAGNSCARLRAGAGGLVLLLAQNGSTGPNWNRRRRLGHGNALEGEPHGLSALDACVILSMPIRRVAIRKACLCPNLGAFTLNGFRVRGPKVPMVRDD